jgi:RNA polymerase sigma-70 factor (ECF subfamily)
MIGAAGSAEDVVQDVFMTVIREARRYDRQRATVVAWLLGIARNYARRRLAERRFEPLAERDEGPAVDSDPADGLARMQETRALRRALAGMPVVYREAIVMCDLQELSYEDAAAAAGCAIGTIRSRLHRGRAMLAARMKEPGNDRTGTREGARAAERHRRRAAG